MRMPFGRRAGAVLAALVAAGLAGEAAGATSAPRIAPIEPERILAQKPAEPGGAQPGQQQPQAEAPQGDEPVRLEPLPTGAELQAFVQRSIAPGFEGIRSFDPVPNVTGVYRVEMGDQALPSFFVNLVEDGNVIAPDRAAAEFQNGFGNCRDSTAGERFAEGGLVIQSFTATCRAQGGNERFLFLIAGHDDQRTQVLAFMVDPRHAEALRPRALEVFRSITTGN